MAGYYEYTPQERKREVDATISSLCFAVTSLITSAAYATTRISLPLGISPTAATWRFLFPLSNFSDVT